jgi:plasmid stabilization system protein ParE
MEYKIKWLSNASLTYFDEIDFIFEKWNYKEVQKFILLVEENLIRLSVNPKIGIPIKYMFRLVLSKQTTLFYTIHEKEKRIDLIIFWNNSKNPDDLVKLL